MQIFVTGGSGFLGQHLIRYLTSAGHEVKALSRTDNAAKLVASAGATPIRGDILNPELWVAHLAGTQVFIHCASPVKFWGPWREFYQGIVVATKLCHKAAQQAKIPRFIYISSEAVLQDKLDLVGIDEMYAYPKTPNSFYGKAKKEAELALINATSEVFTVILRPTFIWGEHAPALDTLKRKVQKGAFIWVDEGRASFEAVHVANVVRAIELAMTHGVNRQVYFVTDGEESSVKDFFTQVFQALKVSVPTKSLPSRYLALAAKCFESLWRALHLSVAPPLSRFELAFVAMGRRYKIDKIKRDLGYVPIVSRAQGFSRLAENL